MQEQIDNGDLTARLDDARNLLRDRGVEPDVKLGSRRARRAATIRRRATTAPAARTLPTGRPVAPRRKAPFAQISGPVNVRRHRSRMTTGPRPSRANAAMPRTDRSGRSTRRRPRPPLVPHRSAPSGCPSPTPPTIRRFRSADSVQLDWIVQLAGTSRPSADPSRSAA